MAFSPYLSFQPNPAFFVSSSDSTDTVVTVA
eukprot:CAMPEP_0178599638 /NCGR_PEP_ID=MMETSP0697-20121206/33429_1 /TAXON_ID=265572 /ORGANISM="Extubocellulus spinifer, Strain CCMP396" /LENGTH=30 /DNA_ID= /DNA_START= /DNA_END= /DNA_ORIENTATION=